MQLPVEPMRRMLIPTEPFDGVSHEIPMVIDMSNGFHFRPESLGFLLAWNDPEETPGFNTDFDPAFIEKVLVRAADRVPCFENLAVNPKRAWAGLYEMSPIITPSSGRSPRRPASSAPTASADTALCTLPPPERWLPTLFFTDRPMS